MNESHTVQETADAGSRVVALREILKLTHQQGPDVLDAIRVVAARELNASGGILRTTPAAPIFDGLPRHYSEADVAQYLDVDVRTVKQLLDCGELAFFPLGKRRRITFDALRDFMTRTRKPILSELQQTAASASDTETKRAPRAKVGRPFKRESRPFASPTLTQAILKRPK